MYAVTVAGGLDIGIIWLTKYWPILFITQQVILAKPFISCMADILALKKYRPKLIPILKSLCDWANHTNLSPRFSIYSTWDTKSSYTRGHTYIRLIEAVNQIENCLRLSTLYHTLYINVLLFYMLFARHLFLHSLSMNYSIVLPCMDSHSTLRTYFRLLPSLIEINRAHVFCFASIHI